jgi:flagellum-specific peptidoglycan hydrolase FlgJ
MPQIAKVYINAAQAAQKAYGVPASVSLAQFALESGYGRYDLGVNNFFGIKYGQNVICDGFVEKQTKEFINGKYITITARFAKFNSVEGGFLEHARFIAEHPQLSRAMELKDSPDKFVCALQDGNVKYATDPQYVEKLTSIMKSQNLYQYDLI